MTGPISRCSDTPPCHRRRCRQLRAKGHELRGEDIARLSPLKHRNLNLLGRYSFAAGVPAAGVLRPLPDPDTPELDEDDGGGDPDYGLGEQRNSR
ncbi:hypothetical protein RKD33_007272 [Streptomyces sp. SAI-129]